MKKNDIHQNSTTLIFLSPWILTLALFWVFPLLYSLYLSFTNYSLGTAAVDFVGLKNYFKLFYDAKFLASLKNTFIFVIGTIPFTTVFALLLALLINRKIKFATFFRSAYFLPSLVSLVVMALVFTSLYQKGGYLEFLFSLTGLPTPERGFLLTESTALPSIMFMDIWIASGYYMLIFLAGLKSIPDELYEAAQLDGASKVQQFFRITLPALRPTALYIILINTIKSFQVFIEIYIMSNDSGGPNNATTTIVYYIYDIGLRGVFNMGKASAAAYILFFIIMIVAVLQLKIFGYGKATYE
jgi:multiple sugar transport system permease protein